MCGESEGSGTIKDWFFQLILDLHYFYTFLADQQCCIEDLGLILSLFKRDFQMFTFD